MKKVTIAIFALGVMYWPLAANAQSFTDISASLVGVYESSVAWGDYDNDGDLDILLTGRSSSGSPIAKVYRNDLSSFTDIGASLAGVNYSSVDWGDYDNDGDLDILLTGYNDSYGRISKVYRNDNGSFVDIPTSISGVYQSSVAWGDYDNDGDLDILLTGYSNSGRISKVYRNDNGNFTDIAVSLTAVQWGSVAWGDYDNDEDLDILLTGTSNGSVSGSITRVYRNDNGSFVDITAPLGGAYIGSVAWGDYDNDGDLDILLAGYDYDGSYEKISKIYRNDNGSFVDINAFIVGVVESSVAWGDYDNDGDLDILLSGNTGSTHISKLYRNDDGSFIDLALTINGIARGSIAWGDYDNDGDLDILLAGNEGSYSSPIPVSKVYRNNISTGNTVPFTPANLTSSVTGYSVSLNWDKSTDNETPQNGLTYNLRLGTSSGGVETVSPMADGSTGYCKVPQLGNTNHNNSWTIENLLGGTYYWNIQAIDNAFAGSGFAAEQSFVIYNLAPTLTSISPDSGYREYTLEVVFTGTNFLSGVTLVDFGANITVNSTTVNSSTELTANITIGATTTVGLRDVSVTNAAPGGGTVSLTDGFNVIQPSFTDISAALVGVRYSSVAWGDYDNDGDLDILLTGNMGSYNRISKVYRNDSGSFTDISASLTGVDYSSVAWGNYDNDGDLDILITGQFISKIYRNDEGSFTDIASPLEGVRYSSAAWGDYDNDGDLDILLTGEKSGYTKITKLYRNDNGNFVEVQISLPGIYKGSVAWGDYDNDGDLDILFTGYGYSKIYRNDGGSFIDISAPLVNVSYSSVAWGDYDSDGDLDILLTGSNISKVYRNDGGNFVDINATLTGVASGCVAWGDYDNDGDLDILLTGSNISKVYQNDSGSFVDISAPLLNVTGSSVAWGDYDNDGDLDILLTGNSNSGGIAKVYRNNIGTANTTPTMPTNLTSSVTGNSVTLSWDKATDSETSQNGLTYNMRLGTTSGGVERVSPMADVTTGYRKIPQLGNTNHINSWTINSLPGGTYYWSVQAIDNAFAGSGFASEQSFTFSNPVPTLTSISPDSGYRQETLDVVLTGTNFMSGVTSVSFGSNITVNSTTVNSSTQLTANITIAEDAALGERDVSVTNSAPGGGTATLTNGFTVNEPPFTNISTSLTGVERGSVAWGDYDNDGDLDVLVTGYSSSGSVSKIYRNDGGGNFTDISASLIGVQDSAVDWGDYDNDGDLDILLSGYFQSRITRIYRNDGGSFTNIGASLANVDKGSVAWGDYDNDGDLDILLTGSVSSSIYISKVYRNDNGSFIDISASLTNVGFYSSCAWGDYDNDGDLDILLAGFSSSSRVAKIYRNDDGSFIDISASLTGVDRASVAWGDYDSDGDLDVLLTGLTSSADNISKIYRNDSGSFTDISAGLTGVYVSSVAWGDYDNDGDLDILMAGQAATGRVSKLYRNDSGSFNEVEAMLTGVHWSSVAWGDYDEDGDIDILLTGNDGSTYITKIYRNNITISNTVPVAPSNLSSSVNLNTITFSWDKSTDNQTAQNSLTYNLYLGTSSAGVQKVSPHANVTNGYRKIAEIGNTNHNNMWKVKKLPGGTYYWSVQAIDNAFAGSSFANEQGFSFNNPTPTLTSISPESGYRERTLDVVFTGTNFTDGITTVSFGTDVTVNSTTVNSSTQLTANITIASDADLGSRDVSVSNPEPGGGTATLPNGFVVNEIPFTDISASIVGVNESSANWGDYENDGDLDILITGWNGSQYVAVIYRNDTGSFSYFTSVEGIRYSSAEWGDYDNDGDLDVLRSGYSISSGINTKIWNNNDGIFSDINASLAGVDYSSLAWGDYDNDGDLDILLTGYTGSTNISKIYRNDSGSFTDISAPLTAVRFSSVAWGDYDNDGDLDILLTGYTGSAISKIYRNDGGSFTDISASLIGVEYSSVAWGDYDSDGDLDILLTGYTGSIYVSKIYRNDSGSFSDISASLTGVRSSSVAWGDYDNDGDLDMLLTGYVNCSTRICKVYQNSGGSFEDINAFEFGVYESSVAWGDYDNDGDLDILLTGYNGSTRISKIYRNNCNTSNTVPNVPSNLLCSVSGSSATLSWDKSTDSQTAQDALTYNLRVGNTSGGTEIVSSMADVSTGYRKVVQLGNTNHNNSWTINSLADGNYFWSMQAIDNAFAGSPFAPEKSFSIPETPTVLLETKIFLEGPYDTSTDEMSTTLNSSGPIPTTSPYSEDPRTVTSIPADITDWVLVQLRSSSDGSAVVSKSAFLHKDGRIVADDGTTGQITLEVASGSYFIVIKHRNHLGVMSANAVALSSGNSTLYDFITGSGQYYGSGGAKELETNVWGMWSGDINQDGQTTTADFTQWFNSARAGDSGYQTTDINLDAQVTTSDFTKWFNNARAGASSEVP